MILARLSPLCRERDPDWCAARFGPGTGLAVYAVLL